MVLVLGASSMASTCRSGDVDGCASEGKLYISIASTGEDRRYGRGLLKKLS